MLNLAIVAVPTMITRECNLYLHALNLHALSQPELHVGIKQLEQRLTGGCSRLSHSSMSRFGFSLFGILITMERLQLIASSLGVVVVTIHPVRYAGADIKVGWLFDLCVDS